MLSLLCPPSPSKKLSQSTNVHTADYLFKIIENLFIPMLWQ